MTDLFRSPEITIDHLNERHSDLKERVLTIEKNYVKSSEISHYATKDGLWLRLVSLFLVLCSAYWFLTPMFVKAEFADASHKLDQILTATQKSEESSNKPKR
jgi:hypothetical protein